MQVRTTTAMMINTDNQNHSLMNSRGRKNSFNIAHILNLDS